MLILILLATNTLDGVNESFERFLNKYQEFAFKIDVTLTGKNTRHFKGMFYWLKDVDKTACSLIYEKQAGHRSFMVRNGQKTYHYITFADPRNKTTQTNMSNTPLNAFFMPVVSLQNDERFTKTLMPTQNSGVYVLEIRHFTDTKKTKEHAKIYLQRQGDQWRFKKWEIIRCHGGTYINFQEPISVSPSLRREILNPAKYLSQN